MTKRAPLALSLAYPGFSRRSRTTDTSSEHIATRDARIAFLDRYLELVTDVVDVRFHVRFRDNGIMSAPSDWRIVAAMKVAPSDIAAWTEGLSTASSDVVDLAWWDELALSEDPRFVGEGAPQRFVREGRHTYVITYENGVVLKLVATDDPRATS